ncbi:MULTISPECIES: NAD(P)H-dependent glycerol-3-phosphate dehydrogenase [unclassified Methylomonas]|uniref:NAD(P)H-dependent glycerol-3-phosphate dehydrogenase n=1 Tax=unclassified Methylomonas TaxID=2608980 RepID=UPI0008D995B1|nr:MULTISPECIES: NAD(P)H-dependent glycerol-3-phosphate dehydrogenase [unclassified Methylomonas]NJA04468.1 NAD(P)-dependent glycerol-3-phosphate dehydrogenase [Methylococcaceae bacterium WWC4]OHX35664.1 glycerol-3-phosphate dehydrogenase [Methylomonas sp. LWB]WGS85864.1 NAD(P)H-dependent glycerol-3-phosphate dehydrogenase [Methylomonas sp. UP202]
MPPAISIFGAGSWGTALAIQAARNGSATMLWAHNPRHVADLNTDRQNRRYLPDKPFPANLAVTSNLKQAVEFSDILLISVPSHAFRDTLTAIKPMLDESPKIAWATKGFDGAEGALLSDVAADVLGHGAATAVLSGPTFAREVADDLPTALTVASISEPFAAELAGILHNQRFRVYTSTDIVGVQVGGACKNVLAIAAGIADGLGFGANTRSALITRGLSEIIRLGIRLGGQPDTFMGLAGLGDLILTCTDDQSRNRRFGLALGQGKSQSQALADINQAVEGISAARLTQTLAQKHLVEMPITEQVYNVLFNQLAPLQAVQNLLGRNPKSEY